MAELARLGELKTERERIEDALNEIAERFVEYEFDPLGFVMWAYPWGEAGTALEKEDGPEQWQKDLLNRLGDGLRAGGELGAVLKEFVSAGHGVGKSALVSWLIHWAMSKEDTRGVVTAMTDGQLRTKTWAELAKWHQLYIARELFSLNSAAIMSADPKKSKSWRIDAIPWSVDNTEAFAGMHNKNRRVLIIFDEASGIADKIFEVTEGATTDADTQIVWCCFGNPTRTTGAFHKNCTRPVPGVHYTRVDSRSVRFSNKKQIQAWVDEYGEDSDFVRVRVKGQFPRAGSSNFISPELVTNARKRNVPRQAWIAYPVTMAVDPARFGDDWSVITLRQGMKVHQQVGMYGFDGIDLAGRIWEIIQKSPDPVSCIVYDANGNGADLDSALRRMPNLPQLIPVMWGVPAKDDKQYFNQRSECWGKMRDWLEAGQIPDNDEIAESLTSLDYGYDARFRIQLESKQDLKKRGGKSPDHADSLALSFIPELIDRKTVTAKARPVTRRHIVWSST